MNVSARLQQNILASAMIVTLAIAGPVFCGTATAAAPVQQNHQTTSPQHWLGQAQEMLGEGRVELAEQYVQLAETLLQRQPGLKLDYTPEMARQKIAQMRTGGLPQVAPVVQQNFSQVANTTARSAAAPAAAAPAQPAVAPQLNAAPLQQDLNVAAQSLLKARQAIAVGDVATAKAMAAAAQEAATDFSTLGDSPALIGQLIDQQTQLTTLRSEANPNYNRGAASFLLSQANALIKYKDLKTARMLIEQSQQFNVAFTPDMGNPQQLLTVIDTLEGAQPVAAEVATKKQQALSLLSQAQLAIDQERWEDAGGLVAQAKTLKVADSDFADTQLRPWQLELQIQNALKQGNTNSFVPDEGGVVHAAFNPAADKTKNVTTAAVAPVKSSFGDTTDETSQRGMNLYQSGVQALNASEFNRATEYFQLASEYPNELTTTAKLTIEGHLRNHAKISDTMVKQATAETAEPATMDLQSIRNEQQAQFRRIQSAIYKERAAAEKLLETNPNQALEKLTMVRSQVESAEISPDTRRPLLTLIDRDITEIQAYIEENLPEILNDEQNEANRDLIERRAQRRLDTEEQLADLVGQYNELIDERRFDEAGLIARQAMDLAPDSEISAVMDEKFRAESNAMRSREIKALKQQSNFVALSNADAASIMMDERTPLLFNDHEEYLRKTGIRMRKLESGRYESEAERQIWNVLRNTDVQGEYRGTLNEAVSQLAMQAGVNIIFDGVALEGVATDQQIDVPLTQPIKLENALKIILQNAGLVYAVEDEVIKVTTPESQRASLSAETYYIGDLVMPMNVQRDPMQMLWNNNPYGNQGLGYGGGMMNVNGQAPQTVAAGQTNAVAMAQQLGGGGVNPFNGGGQPGLGGQSYGGPAYGRPAYGTVGGASLGGISLQDFTPLIDLIQSTISSDTWADTGQGEGTIQAYPANLSLVVNNTQEVQDQIVDLLKKLRELNDVQIVIEVRFITLSDDFFERVGVDFDFALNDNLPDGVNPIADDLNRSATVGLTNNPLDGNTFQNGNGVPGNFDLEFLQDSFTAAQAVTGFAGFQPAQAASFGFAILSDIEVYLLIQAAKGSDRTNLLQSPTVTMFNGQSASVTDGFSRPFVTSVTPVVGDFAVAHQPVITILPDGTNLNVSAVVSNDRRSVRMTLVPQFTQIGDVQTFTFSGSQTTEVSTNSLLDDLLDIASPDDSDDEVNVNTQGVTVQLPIIANTSVSTVVSVPDGGTILLGGIKRMSERRTERGVPFLSNVPYINRLFKNVSIGRETQNLMMMVTPRIIIQAEEEAAQIGETSN